MQKKVLSEQSLYYGEIKMPKGFEINPLNLTNNFFKALYREQQHVGSKDFDKLNAYIIEFINLNYNIALVNKDSWTNIFLPNEKTDSMLNVDPVDLKNSADFTLLYGINTIDCDIKINYDDNRRKGRDWTIGLPDNNFVMFPSTNTYSIINKQKESLNFIQTITYEYI
tara:strand:+ start:377 stop:880 length:504 start_codon:yes stop_codon:yes gene_type:complete